MINYGGNMKLLFTLDSKNYTDDLEVIERFAVRGLICKNGLWAMQKSKNGEYKIPGGGIEKGETQMSPILNFLPTVNVFFKLSGISSETKVPQVFSLANTGILNFFENTRIPFI